MSETVVLEQYKGTTILTTLLNTSNPINRKGLAQKIAISMAVLSKAVNRLIEAGLIAETGFFTCPHCKKEITSLPLAKSERILSLTEKGKKIASILNEAVEALRGMS